MTQPSKICVSCGEDCSTKPRTKDRSGRYLCRACYDARQSSVATAEADPEPLAVDFGVQRTCPNCGTVLAPDVVMCMSCGFNTKTGRAVSVMVAAEPVDEFVPRDRSIKKCRQCGYDLAGIKTARCPECGLVNMPVTKREIEQKESRAIGRREYTKPIIIFAVAFGIFLAFAASLGATRNFLEISLIKYGVNVPLGMAVYFVCCMMWIGFDAPWRLTALRLLATYTVVDLVAIFAFFIPFPAVGLITIAVATAAMMVELMDLDFQDALIVAVLTMLARIVLGMVILVYLHNAGLA